MWAVVVRGASAAWPAQAHTHPPPTPDPPTLYNTHKQQRAAAMCPGPQHEKSVDAATVHAAAPAAGKEEGVHEFFRSYTDEPHRSR